MGPFFFQCDKGKGSDGPCLVAQRSAPIKFFFFFFFENKK
jgi:hypothetical protein